jgi:hypothetical protein
LRDRVSSSSNHNRDHWRRYRQLGRFSAGRQHYGKSDETGAVRETATNEAGRYAVQALRPGRYSITATMANFKTAVVTGREVQVSIPAAVNFVLELGDVAQQVSVSAEGAELLNTTTATLATTISQTLVESLPNQTRNFFDLLALSPNTSPQYFGNGALSFGSHSVAPGECGREPGVVRGLRGGQHRLGHQRLHRWRECPDRALQHASHDPVGVHH